MIAMQSVTSTSLMLGIVCLYTMCLGNFVPSVDAVSNKIHELNQQKLSLDVQASNNCDYVESGSLKRSGNFSVLHLNIRSLNKNYALLTELLFDLKQSGVVVDAILLCETWLNDLNDSLISIDGYTCLTKHRTGGKTGGGPAIYVLSEYNPAPIEIANGSLDGVYESMFVSATVNKKELILGEIYRVPNSLQDPFNNYIKQTLPQFRNKNLILGADQNLDLLKAFSHHQTNRFLNTILENNLIPTILKPTRVTHQSSTLIDNVYVSAHLKVNKSSILLEDISDHFPCVVQTEFQCGVKSHKIQITTRKLNDRKVLELNNALLHKDWVEMLNPADSVNENYTKFIGEVQRNLDLIAPLKTKTLKPCNVLREPWMTVNLLKCSKKAKRLYQKALGKKRDSAENHKYLGNG